MNLTSKDGSVAAGLEFADFVVARGPSLHRTALVLTHQGQTAQDLVQIALAHAWRSWAQIGENPEAQVRQIMVTEFISSWRWRWRGEVSELSEVPVLPTLHGDDGDDAVSMRQVLMAALAILPRRQRAVVVLRFFHDYTEAATADTLGVKVSTVKSQTVKALAALQVFEELLQGAPSDLSGSAEAGDVSLKRTLHDLPVALREQAEAAVSPDVDALVAGARRAAATRRRRLTVIGVTTAAVLVVSGLVAMGVTTTTPPASQATATPSAPAIPALRTAVVVTGTRTCTISMVWDASTIRADGSLHNRGTSRCTETSSDPRVAGTEVEPFESVRWEESGNAGAVVGGTGRLTNAGGSWVGVFSGISDFWTGETHTRWSTGTGSYAGLSYFISIEGGGESTKTHGLIFPGNFPPETLGRQ
jgi:RNA polymerase sigma-70 factor (sigma-E family)